MMTFQKNEKALYAFASGGTLPVTVLRDSIGGRTLVRFLNGAECEIRSDYLRKNN